MQRNKSVPSVVEVGWGVLLVLGSRNNLGEVL